MKKASVIPWGYRTIPQRNYTTAISTSIRQVFQKTLIPTHRHFSALAETRSNTDDSDLISVIESEIDREEEKFPATSIPTHHNVSALVEKRSSSDDTLLSVIESEIGCAEEKFRKFLETPREFPFKIVDIAKENRSVTLTREYQDEEIKVKVHNCYHMFANWNGSVSNKSGLTCEFTVTFAADGLTIDKLNVKNPAFKYLDENQQKTLRTYLQVRGIEASTMKTLYIECMTKYKHRKYMAWIIEDNGAEKYLRITLTREYQGEEIILKLPYYYSAAVGEVEKKNESQYVSLDVSVSKKNGLSLEFNVKAYVDGITIV
ncbi:hypothetical protein MKW94_004688, partial [Papaver nudicaule]|nr:hypothetical protein [Papaver nudicaule]